MVVRTYCDASGKVTDAAGYALLVGHYAPIEEWKPRIENPWSEVLGSFGVTALHTADLMAKPMRGEYRDWDSRKRRDFLSALLAVLSRASLLGVAYAVSLDAYKAVRRRRPLPSVEEICNAMMFASVGRSFPADRYSYVFDRGDKFRHYADQLWNRWSTGVMGRIVEIDSIASAHSPAVQCADLAGWAARTHWVRTPGSFPSDLLVQAAKASTYENSMRFGERELATFDFDRLLGELH